MGEIHQSVYKLDSNGENLFSQARNRWDFLHGVSNSFFLFIMAEETKSRQLEGRITNPAANKDVMQKNQIDQSTCKQFAEQVRGC